MRSFAKLHNLSLAAILFVVTFCIAPGAQGVGPRRFGQSLCKKKGYHCVKATRRSYRYKRKTPDGPESMRFVIRDTWETMFPDKKERKIVKKINRMNIELELGDVVAVPDTLHKKTLYDFSPFLFKIKPHRIPFSPTRTKSVTGADEGPSHPRIAARSEKVLIYDLKLMAWAAYDEEGWLVRWGPGVGGKDFCEDIEQACLTPTGEMRIISVRGPDARSTKYPLGCSGASCAEMPWFMEFHGGYGFHGSDRLPGRHASHGCVRLFGDDAKWLNQRFVELGLKVVVRPY